MGLWFVAYRLRIYGSLQIIDTIRTKNALEKRVDDLELCFDVLFSAKTEFGRAKEHQWNERIPKLLQSKQTWRHLDTHLIYILPTTIFRCILLIFFLLLFGYCRCCVYYIFSFVRVSIVAVVSLVFFSSSFVISWASNNKCNCFCHFFLLAVVCTQIITKNSSSFFVAVANQTYIAEWMNKDD